MADLKITALTQTVAPAETDILPIVVNPGTTPVTQKVQTNDVLNLKTLYSVVPAGDFALTASTAAQAALPPTGDVFTLAANKTYLIEGIFYINKSGTACTVALLFGGTVTFTSLKYRAVAANSPLDTTTPTGAFTSVDQATATVINASATTGMWVEIRGLIRTLAAGTFIPQIQFSVAPTTPIMAANSYFKMTAQETSTSNVLGAVA